MVGGLGALPHLDDKTLFSGSPSREVLACVCVGLGRGEEKRFLSLLFNPSINPSPPKGEEGIY